MERGYQFGYSDRCNYMYDHNPRQNKARTMVMVLEHFLSKPLNELSLINVGGSAGIIDNYLACHFGHVTGVDIDEKAIAYAREHFQVDNLDFVVGDAMQLQYPDASFEVAVCSHVYEHVPDAARMMDELYRVLKPGGVCFFAAANRLMWNEPHYNLKLLSVMPRPLAHRYISWAGKADFYYEQHLSYWGLKKLVHRFKCTDYTRPIIETPEQFGAEYMLPAGSRKAAIARFVARYLPWLVPSYIWMLEKPGP